VPRPVTYDKPTKLGSGEKTAQRTKGMAFKSDTLTFALVTYYSLLHILRLYRSHPINEKLNE
jgi:hypothetical protein